jgi:dephospho-CoA kinase|tara:strand:- start:3203 stop:3799 length:597 start_codon:yes stop_codon:yes gene_type:complete
MFTVGITGGIATGKSLATDFFAAKDIDIIDADKISRSLQEPGQVGYEAIVKKLGDAVLSEDKTIIRSKLRNLAFRNNETKKWLEDLMHPLIGQIVLEGFEQAKSKWAIYSAPLWSEKNKFDRIMVIDAPKALQIERIIKRDKSSAELAEQIVDQQLHRNKRVGFANDFLMNDSTIESFEGKLDFYFNLYNKLADGSKN